MSTPGPPPGWYQDPGQSGGWRWWDGATWTPHLSPPAPPAYRPPVGPTRAEGAVAPFALAATLLIPAHAVYSAALAWFYLGGWRDYFHQLRVILDNPGTPYTAPRLPEPGGLLAVSLVILAAEILFWVWQYRAATVARALGYPARHSPGWGVGSWFVPVVNLWMPYQALRDCLPPGHPTGAVVLRTWLLLLACGLLAPGVFVAQVLDAPLGVVLFSVLVVLEGALGASAWTVVAATRQNHRQAVGA
jgi:hypothetical protein